MSSATARACRLGWCEESPCTQDEETGWQGRAWMPLSPAASRWPVAVTTELRPKPGSYLLDIRHTRQKRKRKKKSWTVFCPQRGRHSRRRRRNNNPLPAYCLGWLGNRLLINIALASPLPSLSMYVVRSLALLASASSHSCSLSLTRARARVVSHQLAFIIQRWQ